MSSTSTNKRNNILKELDILKTKDFSFSDGHILGSMCTQPHPIAREAYLRFLETNLGDPNLFPGTKQIELKLLEFIKNLLHAPQTATGQIVSGGTEGNITAMWIAKQLSGKTDIILPQGAHFSFQKIASLLDMNLINIPLTKEYTLDITKVKQHITQQTAAIIGIAGSTELGTIDPIPTLSDICYDEHIFFHVDAAFGGYIIPFLQELNYTIPKFDFALHGVSTISLDAHKMGYAAIPIGALIMREAKWLDSISVESPYISVKKHAGILGTRSGGPVAGAYAVARYLGMDGYKKVVEHCMSLTRYTEKRLTELGLSLLVKPTMNVLGVKLSKPEIVATKLSRYGWRVNAMDHLSCIRIVLMPQITKKNIDEFIPVLKQVCEEVGEL